MRRVRRRGIDGCDELSTSLVFPAEYEWHDHSVIAPRGKPI